MHSHFPENKGTKRENSTPEVEQASKKLRMTEAGCDVEPMCVATIPPLPVIDF